MATIHVDGKEYEVNGADNLLQACLSLGLDIPYFCWHPALESVGACRQCAVKQYQNAEDTRGRLVMSCMTPATDGTFISIDDEEAKQFRESVVEWLMTNHPHDCPVCEEGGNCHLQDMTVMTGHSFRRYRFTKRTHRNQDLGPFISHEMNRCIACYRCVRYYKDYADGTDLGVYGAHDNVYFGRRKTVPWKANSPVTWSRFVRPASSPIKRTPSVTIVNGTCSLRRASASSVPSAVTSARASAMANYAVSKTVTTAPLTTTSSATAVVSAMAM